MGFKLTKLEKHWILYDVGNSAFTLLITTIMPIYFNSLATAAKLSEVDYLAYWGYAASIATLFVAFLGPILGTVADKKNHKKPLFVACILLGAVGCLVLGLAKQWLIFLIIYVIAKIGYSLSLVLYDSMLGDITEEERMDSVSSQGYAWGYIGSCIPFVACLGVVLGADFIGITMSVAMMIAFLIVAVWWIAAAFPLIKNYKQKHFITDAFEARKNTFLRLGTTLKEIFKNKKVFLFLLAFFFYIDGVYTIIDMATAYGSSLGLDTTGLLLALLVTQIVAFPSSIIFGRLARKIASEKLITVCICAYFGIAVFAMFMSSQLHFWILAVCVGMFQGGIQALSRSYFTKIIPAEKSGEYFGLLDICGKGASFMGTFVVSLIAQITGVQNIGVGSLAVFFIVGLILFRLSAKKN
ncbi:MAG: MFS transporter [Clostridia bacterium]|nr:MFS transporter [Clostridia bacterium]